MDFLYSPKTPVKELDEEMMERQTLAQRKPYNSNLFLARFLSENTDSVREKLIKNKDNVNSYHNMSVRTSNKICWLYKSLHRDIIKILK